MKSFLLFFVNITFLVVSVTGQTAKFINSITHDKTNLGTPVSFMDMNSNVYTVGYSSRGDSARVETTNETTSFRVDDEPTSYILKSDSNGAKLWLKTFGPNQHSFFKVESGAVDIDGNIYLIGSAKGRVDFQPGQGSKFDSIVGLQFALVKLNQNGVYLNHVAGSPISTNSGSNGTLIDISENGDIYAGGAVFGEVAIGDSTKNTLTSGSSTTGKAIIACYGNNLNLNWSFEVGDSLALIKELKSHHDNSVTIAGRDAGSFDADPSTSVKNVGVNSNYVFVLRYSNLGKLMHAKQIGQEETPTTAHQFMMFKNGKMMILGNLYGTTDLDPGVGTKVYTGRVPFSVLLDENLDFVSSDTGITHSMRPYLVENVKNDGYTGFYTIGTFPVFLDFKNKTQMRSSSNNFSQLYQVEYDEEFNYISEVVFPNGSDFIWMHSITMNDNFILVGGKNSGEIILSPTLVKERSRRGQEYAFSFLLSNNGLKLSNERELPNRKLITIFPNPAMNTINFSGDLRFKKGLVKALSGKVVMEVNSVNQSYDISSLEPSIYLVELINDESRTLIKFIKQ